MEVVGNYQTERFIFHLKKRMLHSAGSSVQNHSVQILLLQRGCLKSLLFKQKLCHIGNRCVLDFYLDADHVARVALF